jgi:hypothetical protein
MTQRPLGSQTGKPQRQDATATHGGIVCSLFVPIHSRRRPKVHTQDPTFRELGEMPQIARDTVTSAIHSQSYTRTTFLSREP